MVTLRPETLTARLRDLGIATPQQLELAKRELATSQERFSAILVRQGVLRDEEAGKRMSIQLGAVPQRVGSTASASASTRLPSTVWQAHRLIPIEESPGKLIVATDDPLSVFALEFLGRQCGCTVEAVLVREQEFASISAAAAPDAATPPSAPSSATPSTPAAPAPAPGAPAAPPVPPPPAPPQKPAATIIGLTTTATTATPPASPQLRTAAPADRPKPSEPLRPAPAPPAAGRGGVRPAAPTTSSTTPAAPRKESAPGSGASSGNAEDEPIIRLIDSILSEAVRMRASDIHIEPATAKVSVRYRVDGVLHDVNSPPKALQGPMISRIKIMAGLNIAEKRLPQDGRLQLSVEQRPLDVRVSILPAMHGESIVMRLLDRSQPVRGLPEMGMRSVDTELWERLIHRPHGMVLVTGPTGSGKTTTLYGALTVLNQPDRKLITVEDPVEYQLAGVNQVLVKSSIGLTFAAGLRAMLRQAPDVILVGEIRDQETAQIAVQAALTGHLVLSTLHTNDAPSAITRLIDMGIPPFLVSSTVQGVLAQRLVRRLCSSCKTTVAPTEEERAFLGPPEPEQLFRGGGCDACHGSGFFGRIGIFEILVITEPVRQLIVKKAGASAIRVAAVSENMRGLREDGCIKIREGSTTMEEVLRVVAGSEE